MELLDVITKRRSIRIFDNKSVPHDIVEKIVNHSLMAPSGRNLKPTEIIVVQNKSTIEKIMKTREGAFSFLRTAPICIVVTAKEESNTWISDASIVATYIQLLAVNYGLGSCWGHVYERYHNGTSVEEEIRNLLKIPSAYRILCVIGLGYPAEQKSPHSLEEVQQDKIHRERW
ncbi:MAG: nitroreductase family protein [Fervidobacterium sp.]|jgi:nitroreductase